MRMTTDTKGMQAPRKVNGHRISIVRIDAYLNDHKVVCTCGYVGMVRQSAAVADGDVDRHAYTAMRGERCYTAADPFGFPTVYPL
jgi:hypothetical protein